MSAEDEKDQKVEQSVKSSRQNCLLFVRISIILHSFPVKQLLYAFGDVEDPSLETAITLMELTNDYILEKVLSLHSYNLPGRI